MNKSPLKNDIAGLEDVSYSAEDVSAEPRAKSGMGLPPLPAEIPPPQPPPEHLRKKPHAELLSDFQDLLSEKNVRYFG